MVEQVHPGFVVADPRLVDVAHQPVGGFLRGRERQAQLEDGDDEQWRTADNRVERQQQRGNDAAQRGGQEIHEGPNSEVRLPPVDARAALL